MCARLSEHESDGECENDYVCMCVILTVITWLRILFFCLYFERGCEFKGAQFYDEKKHYKLHVTKQLENKNV